MRWGSSHSASLGAQDGTVGQTVNTPGAECVSRDDIRGDGTNVWRGRFRAEAALCTEVAQSMFPSTEKKRKVRFLLSKGSGPVSDIFTFCYLGMVANGT